MRKLSRLLGVIALVAFSGFVRAGDPLMIDTADGFPEHGKITEPVYLVWHNGDNDRWHVAVTTAGHRHHFKGRIWIEGEGKFGEVNEWKGLGEIKAEVGEANWFNKALKRGDKDRELTFDVVEEAKHLCGVNFHVEGAGPLKWELGIGGPGDKEAVEHNPEQIFIGKKGHHPPAVPFQTFAHPDEKHHGK